MVSVCRQGLLIRFPSPRNLLQKFWHEHYDGCQPGSTFKRCCRDLRCQPILLEKELLRMLCLPIFGILLNSYASVSCLRGCQTCCCTEDSLERHCIALIICPVHVCRWPISAESLESGRVGRMFQQTPCLQSLIASIPKNQLSQSTSERRQARLWQTLHSYRNLP